MNNLLISYNHTKRSQKTSSLDVFLITLEIRCLLVRFNYL